MRWITACKPIARLWSGLLTRIVEEFWTEVRTHKPLCTRADIAEVIRHSVVREVARLEERRGAPLPERFAALERRRLEEILTAWLELEKGREAFEVIQPEGEREGNVGGIHLAEAVEAFGYRFVGDEDVFLRLLGEREDERLVVSRGRAHNPRT